MYLTRTWLTAGLLIPFALAAGNILGATRPASVTYVVQAGPVSGNDGIPLSELIHLFEEKLGITVLYDNKLLAGLRSDLKITDNRALLETELQKNNMKLERVKDNSYIIVAGPKAGNGSVGKKADSLLPGNATGSNSALTGTAKKTDIVTGKVTDVNGEPIVGATVLEKGSTNGTITDFDGNFTLNVKTTSAVLVFSYIGYLPQEITVGIRTEFVVKLAEDVKLTNEVVVVGYGTQNKRDLTGAVGSVTLKEIASLPVPDIGQAVQGRVAGIQTVTPGAPGSNVTFRIRGTGTINSADPLIVIDGIPTDIPLNAINPDDIAGFDILKDASASAIYGSRGANGVVLITTKKGKAGEGKLSLQGCNRQPACLKC